MGPLVMAVKARRDTAWDSGVFPAVSFDHGAEAGVHMSVLVFYFYNPEESQLELGGAAWAAMEAHMWDLSTALGFSSHVGVTTWSQRNFGTLYMVTSPAYQALL